ncbi:MAG: metallophosphoesterase family protein [Spirochaetales bacterium]|nr:metallophosphoesterase family protein [Spirochaetales bacterium]
MKLAVFADIHGNLRALESVLTDASQAGAEDIVFLGDLVYNGLDPQMCFELLMRYKPMVTIKGNSDEYLEMIPSFVVNDDKDEQLLKHYKYTSIRMRKKARDEIAAFDLTRRFEICGVKMLACHGTPTNIGEGLYESDEATLTLARTMKEEGIQVVLSGHTHIPADFTVDGIRFVNPGAIGFGLDGDTRPSYAIIECVDGKARVQFRRVEYDTKRYIQEVEHASEGFPLFKCLRYALEKGKMPA